MAGAAGYAAGGARSQNGGAVMSKAPTWRQQARASLDKAHAAAIAAGLEGKALEQALFDSYPFGERAYTPYKVWCEERRKVLAGLTNDGGRKASAEEQRERAKLAAWNAGKPL